MVDFLSTHASVVEYANNIQVEGCIVEYITGNVKFDWVFPILRTS